ncbi:MAG: sodium:proton antiporter [Candidatus Nanopelagicales bacterium]|nr:sodium:proton antiporter [Candidatus Nanopelagicales bacterium]
MFSAEVLDIGSSLIFAVVLAGICRNRGWSSAIPLLIAGIAFGLAPFGPQGVSDPELFLVLILAPLVFGEGLTSSIVDLRRVSKPVMALAVGLVVFGAVLVGVVTTWLIPGIWTSMAFALGAILGPTDAVAVSATARKAGLPRRLVNILEGESLVNDGTALTLLRVASVAAAAGSVTALDGAKILVTSVLGGVLVGGVAGWILMQLVRRGRDATVTNAVILVAPLPIYVLAEVVEGSGILAVVLAALVVAHGSSNEVEYTGRLQATGLWRTITFVLQSVAFFLVGLEIPLVIDRLPADELRQLALAVPVVFLTLVVGRFVFVYLMAVLSRGDLRRPEWLIAAWAGTRGPISALAAFTLPVTTTAGAPIPGRGLVISTTFGVVLLSLLLAPTVAWLAGRTSLDKDDDSATRRRVRVALARAALDRLDEIEDESERSGEPLAASVVSRLREMAQVRLDRSLAIEQGDTRRHEHLVSAKVLSVQMMRAEQEELFRLRDSEGLADEILREMQQEIDARIRALG